MLLKKWDQKVQKKIIKGYVKGGNKGAIKITKYLAPTGRHLRYKSNGIIEIPNNYFRIKKQTMSKLKYGESIIKEAELELYLMRRRR